MKSGCKLTLQNEQVIRYGYSIRKTTQEIMDEDTIEMKEIVVSIEDNPYIHLLTFINGKLESVGKIETDLLSSKNENEHKVSNDNFIVLFHQINNNILITDGSEEELAILAEILNAENIAEATYLEVSLEYYNACRPFHYNSFKIFGVEGIVVNDKAYAISTSGYIEYEGKRYIEVFEIIGHRFNGNAVLAKDQVLFCLDDKTINNSTEFAKIVLNHWKELHLK